MRFYRRFVGAVAFIALTGTTSHLAWAQSFVSCERHAAPAPAANRPADNPLPTRFHSLIDNVFQRVVSGYEKRGYTLAPQIAVASAATANAYITRGSTIVVTAPLLQLVGTNERLSFVIAHELAHIALRHPRDATPAMEQQADSLAVQVLAELGFDPCAALDVIGRMTQANPVYSESLESRISHLRSLLAEHCPTVTTIALSSARTPSRP
jgi:predicted Zn-dependent protease